MAKVFVKQPQALPGSAKKNVNLGEVLKLCLLCKVVDLSQGGMLPTGIIHMVLFYPWKNLIYHVYLICLYLKVDIYSIRLTAG